MGSLSLDARLSYETLGHNAELLGSLSASFTREAREASDAYRRALGSATPEAWTRFVDASEALTRHIESVDSIVNLSSRERQARAFFEQIVAENADLLTQRVPALT